MPFITTPERIGRANGLKQGIQAFLTFRFGPAADAILAEILALQDHEVLDKILHSIRTIDNPEQLRPLWMPESSAQGQAGSATNA